MAETPPQDDALPSLPKEPVHALVGPFQRFMHVEAAGGVVLLGATLVALLLANSPWSEGFLGIWKTTVAIELGAFEASHSLKHWINDGLMALFFFVMGLEVKRELVLGELRDLRNAMLPIVAALGGMVVPALVYLALAGGGPAARGWGIPMATDIAFVIGCLAVLGKRVPLAFRVMLVSLAIVDDIGAILVIAVGYSTYLAWGWLVAGLAGVAGISVAARIGVRALPFYAVVGFLVWLAFHESGVHATIAGVILGLQTPARSYASEGFLRRLVGQADEFLRGDGSGSSGPRARDIRQLRYRIREAVSPLEYLETLLHPWMSFLVVPLFALANAGVPIELSALEGGVTRAVGLGLLLGKPAGVVGFSFLAVKLGLAKLPGGVGWRAVLGGGFLAGIGFTMSMFIGGLALDDDTLVGAKVGIFVGSALAAVIGLAVLAKALPRAASGK